MADVKIVRQGFGEEEVVTVDAATARAMVEAGNARYASQSDVDAYQARDPEAGSIRSDLVDAADALKAGKQAFDRGATGVALLPGQLAIQGANAALGTDIPVPTAGGVQGAVSDIASEAVSAIAGTGEDGDLAQIVAEGLTGADINRGGGLTGSTEAKARALRNPGAALAGQIAGEALATAPLAAAGLGARGAALAARGGSLLPRVGYAASQAALEGAVGGAAGAQERAWLQDRRLTAESIVAGAGWGALTGAGVGAAGVGLGAGLGALGGRARRILSGSQIGPDGVPLTPGQAVRQTPQEAQRVLEQHLGRTLPEGTGAAWLDAVADRVADASSFLSGRPRDAIRELLQPGAAGRRARQLAVGSGDAAEEITRSLTDDTGRVLAATRELSEVSRSFAAKKSVVAKNLVGQDENLIRATVLGQLDNYERAARSILEEGEQIAASLPARRAARVRRAAGKLADDITDWVPRLRERASKGDVADAYIALDAARRAGWSRVDEIGRARSRGNEVGVLPELQALAQQRVRDATESMRQTLQDTSVFGAQGEAQRAANEALTRFISASKNQQGIGKLAAKTGETFAGDTGIPLPILEGDADRIARFVRRMGEDGNALTERGLQDYLESGRDYARAMRDLYELPEDKAGAADAAIDAIDRMLGRVDEAKDVVGKRNLLSQLETNENLVAAGMASLGAYQMLGIPGLAIFGTLAKPGQMVRSLAALETLSERFGERATVGVKRLVESGRRSLPGVSDAPDLGAAGTRTAAGFARRMGREREDDRVDLARRYEERVEALADVIRQPEVAIDRAWESTAGYRDIAPETAAQVPRVAMRAAQYLHKVMPKTPQQRIGEPPVRGYVSPTEQLEWLDVERVVSNPLAAYDDLGSGQLTRAQVEAIREVYPSIYSDLQRRTLQVMASNQSPLPVTTRYQLDVLLDLGGAIDPELSPSAVAALQSVYLPQDEPQSSGGGGQPKATEIAESVGTPAQGIVTGLG